jgi:galactokinase
MKNDIYDLLNDIDNQIDTFETVDITSTDLKNWKQSFALKKKTSVKKHTWKKYVRADILLFLMDGRHVFFRKRQESVFCVMRRMRNILEGIWI